MIHHCDVVVTPRRVTVIPTVPAAPRATFSSRFGILVFAVTLLLTLAAASLGAQAPAAGTRPDSAKAAAPVRNLNWTSDKRTFVVGDIIQVMVDEYALARATKDNTNSASRSRQMGVQVSPPSLPGSESAIGDVSGSVGTGDAGTSSQRGNASRDTRYVGQLAVRVIRVTPEGLLEVKGIKTIDVDKNKATLTLSGFLRPIDIGSRDAVGSEALADAQISYSAKGSLGKPKNGIVSKLIGLFSAMIDFPEKKRTIRLALALGLAHVAFWASPSDAQGVPIRDLVVDNQAVPVRLVGYGIVTGLSGTGDNAYAGRGAQHTVQSVANLLRRFDIIVPPELLRTRNVAAVLVTAETSPYLRPGGRFDVQVSSVGDARSLRGGVLWMTPLVAEAGGKAMATAQGELLVDESDIARRRVGYAAASARLSNGGLLEVDLPRPQFTASTTLLLRTPDISVAARIAAVVDSVIGKETAKVEDPGAVTLTLGDSAGGPAAALARIRDLKVEVQRVARIVIDQRSGTVVAGGDLTLGPGMVSVGGLALSIGGIAADTSTQASAGQVRVPSGATVQQLAAALHAVRTPPQQVALVFEALRSVGALTAEVIAR